MTWNCLYIGVVYIKTTFISIYSPYIFTIFQFTWLPSSIMKNIQVWCSIHYNKHCYIIFTWPHLSSIVCRISVVPTGKCSKYGLHIHTVVRERFQCIILYGMFCFAVLVLLTLFQKTISIILFQLCYVVTCARNQCHFVLLHTCLNC